MNQDEVTDLLKESRELLERHDIPGALEKLLKLHEKEDEDVREMADSM